MKPRLAMVGGFLGSGKTTLLLRAGETLAHEHGKQVVMITNDQGEVLVDSAVVKDYGFETAEVVRGCFCCNFQVFLKHARRILEKLKPDVILAEPVGSCAGLMPTLYMPIKEFYSDNFELAPLIVVVDTSRILKIHRDINLLDTEDPIAYLIATQIKEGEVLCLNKIDLVDKSTILEAIRLMKKMKPETEIILTSAKFNVGVGNIIEVILKGASKELPYPDIDMVLYTKAELELAWFDGLYEVTSERLFNPETLIKNILIDISKWIIDYNGRIAHIKAYLRSGGKSLKASITSLEQGSTVTGSKMGHVDSGTLLINARVKLSPERLNEAVEKALERNAFKHSVRLSKIRSETFRPSPPKPQFYIPYSKDGKRV